MSFLAPAILLALAAVVVPVLIHLIQRERKRVVEFPSLMFLRRIPYKSVRRRRIRDWLLLLMRAGALVLIVAAFARPFVHRAGEATGSASGPREVVVLLDRSYSMGYGTRWARALDAARDAVRALGPDDRASLVLFSTGAQADVRSTADRERLLAAVGAARVGAGATRYGPALKLAQSVLAESRLPQREVVLISDFQKSGWNREDAARLPDGARLTPVAVGEQETVNVAVSAVAFQRAPFSGQERVTVSAALVNRGAQAGDVAVALEIDGRAIQTRKERLEPNVSTPVAFTPFTLSSAYTRGTVRVADDALPIDNAFHFVLSPGEPVAVRIVERPGTARDAALYLTRALAIGETPAFRADLATTSEAIPAPAARPRSSGAAAPVVILNDVPVSAALAAQLRRFVADGGGLLAVLGERASWPTEAVDLLGSPPGQTVDRSTGRGAALGSLDYSHPAFALFKAPRSGDFSAVRFFRYRALPADTQPPAEPARATAVLARFDDGRPALLERRAGPGRVLVWASTLDSFWNDLALKPVFLPFVHRLVRHLSRYQEPVPWMTVGQVVEADAYAAAPGGLADAVALTPSGRRVALSPDRAALLELSEQGFYELHTRDTDEGRPLTIAANLDLGESDLTAVDPQELVAAVAGRAGDATAGAGPGTPDQEPLGPAEQERRQGVWWYLLLLGIVLLGIETVWSNRLSRAGR